MFTTSRCGRRKRSLVLCLKGRGYLLLLLSRHSHGAPVLSLCVGFGGRAGATKLHVKLMPLAAA